MEREELAGIARQAEEIAWGAARILLARFEQPLKVEWKGKHEGDDPVTDVDRAVEEFVLGELNGRFPQHAVVGEEGAGSGGEPNRYTWVVDPLDGTMNFLNGLPAFACSLALLEDRAPVAGAIFIPWPNADAGIVLRASLGGGCWLGDRRVEIPEDAALPGRLVVLPRGPFRLQSAFGRAAGERRSVGSIAYELAATSLGVYRYVLFGAPRVWDVAAGILLVREAGGRALSLSPGDRSWQPFVAFETPPRRTKPNIKAADAGAGTEESARDDLRHWRRPILAGAAAAVEQASAGIRLPHPGVMRFFRLLCRRRLAGRGPGRPSPESQGPPGPVLERSEGAPKDTSGP